MLNTKNLLLILLLGLPVVASAGTPHTHHVAFKPAHVRHFDDGIERALLRQRQEIRAGIRRGELTRQEARKLLREHERIAQLKARYERDGRLSRDEREKLWHALNRVQRAIYNERHDAQRRRA
ncbi:MAG: hypothetical protein IRY96_09370 [Burkholderiales bacterium]|nr:hypothetical protein [Burkholderiales bacterium]PZN05734.1 MAG: hypothetical protein DIU74_01675 [Pseudomonadota bacterium]